MNIPNILSCQPHRSGPSLDLAGTVLDGSCSATLKEEGPEEREERRFEQAEQVQRRRPPISDLRRSETEGIPSPIRR